MPTAVMLARRTRTIGFKGLIGDDLRMAYTTFSSLTASLYLHEAVRQSMNVRFLMIRGKKLMAALRAADVVSDSINTRRHKSKQVLTNVCDITSPKQHLRKKKGAVKLPPLYLDSLTRPLTRYYLSRMLASVGR